MVLASIALGSNQGDRLASLRFAVRELDEHRDMQVLQVSSVYESEAHTLQALQSGSPYLNAVLLAKTCISAAGTLRLCKQIERAAGRVPAERWAPRVLDLDLLVCGLQTVHSPTLTLPHPRLAERRFVLEPWHEISPEYQVPPPFEATVAELLHACNDSHWLHKMDANLFA